MQQAIKSNSFCYGFLCIASENCKKTFQTRVDDLEQNIPSDCWFENSACVKVRGGNRQNDGNSGRKTEKVEVELWGKIWRRIGKWLFRNRKKGESYNGDTERTRGGGTGASVPAEKCPLVFGIYSESKGLFASPCGHGFHGNCLTGRGILLAFFLVAVWAVGGRAVGRHQGSLSCHTHTPHTRCGEIRGKVIHIMSYSKYL